MEGILKKVNLAEEQVCKIAELQFKDLNNGKELSKERSDIQGLWHDYIIDDLETFNEMVEYLARIKHQCIMNYTLNYGCKRCLD